MNDEFKKTVLEYMKSHNSMSLSTIGNNTPWASSVFYVNDGFILYFLSDPKTRHGSNIRETGLVSATINEDYFDWRKIKGIQLEGRAEIVTSRLERTKAMALYIGKFPYVAEFFSPKSILNKTIRKSIANIKVYKLVPERIWFIDNDKGFGHREEISIDSI